MNWLPEPWHFYTLAVGLAVGAGLCAWLIPLKGIKLAIWLGGAAALLALLGGISHEYESRGKAKVQADWNAANVAAEKVATAAARRAEVDAGAREAQRDRDFRSLRARNAELRDQLSRACVDPVLLGGMRDSVRASNGESAGGVAPSAPVAAGAPERRGPDGNQVNDWFATVAEMYRKCREQVIGWIEWDERRGVQ